MSDTSAVVRGTGFRAITRYQWLVFLVVWLGWTLDAADFGLFSLVLRPALTELLGFPATGIFSCFALLSVIAMLIGRETKDAPLPK